MKLRGVKVILDANCKQNIRWVFPRERFFEWEPKDERLCRLLGIGYEDFDPTCHEIREDRNGVWSGAFGAGHYFVMHPRLWAALKKKMPELCEDDPVLFRSSDYYLPVLSTQSRIVLSTTF